MAKTFQKSGMSIDISVLGDKELSDALNKLEGLNRTGIFAQASKKSMRVVLRDIKSKAPVDTGAMQRAFGARSIKPMSGRRARGAVGARVLLPTRKMLRIPANAKGYYPAAQEFGWKTHGGGYVPAKRFVRDALYGNRSAVFNSLRTELWKGILARLKRRGMAIPDEVARGAEG